MEAEGRRQLAGGHPRQDRLRDRGPEGGPVGKSPPDQAQQGCRANCERLLATVIAVTHIRGSAGTLPRHTDQTPGGRDFSRRPSVTPPRGAKPPGNHPNIRGDLSPTGRTRTEVIHPCHARSSLPRLVRARARARADHRRPGRRPQIEVLAPSRRALPALDRDAQARAPLRSSRARRATSTSRPTDDLLGERGTSAGRAPQRDRRSRERIAERRRSPSSGSPPASRRRRWMRSRPVSRAATRPRSTRPATTASISSTPAPGRRSAAPATPPRPPRPSRTTAPRCSTAAPARPLARLRRLRAKRDLPHGRARGRSRPVVSCRGRPAEHPVLRLEQRPHGRGPVRAGSGAGPEDRLARHVGDPSARTIARGTAALVTASRAIPVRWASAAWAIWPLRRSSLATVVGGGGPAARVAGRDPRRARAMRTSRARGHPQVAAGRARRPRRSPAR